MSWFGAGNIQFASSSKHIRTPTSEILSTVFLPTFNDAIGNLLVLQYQIAARIGKRATTQLGAILYN